MNFLLMFHPYNTRFIPIHLPNTCFWYSFSVSGALHTIFYRDMTCRTVSQSGIMHQSLQVSKPVSTGQSDGVGYLATSVAKGTACERKNENSAMDGAEDLGKADEIGDTVVADKIDENVPGALLEPPNSNNRQSSNDSPSLSSTPSHAAS